MRLTLLFVTLLCTCGRAQSQPTSSPADQDHIHSIFFGGGSYYIVPDEAARLKQFLDEIPNLDAYEIEIQGHTDDIGNREYNLRLSDYRARTVRDRLIAYPLQPEMMQMLPLGEDEPNFDNATWEGKLSNRRVDVILKRIVF
jgi:OOP family OmpA-OmpF porin